jgi:hypothetical protein
MTQTITYKNDLVNDRPNCSASGLKGKNMVGKINDNGFYFRQGLCLFCGKSVGVNKEGLLNVHIRGV